MGTTLSSDKAYLILVRHASRDLSSDPDEAKQSMYEWNQDLKSTPPSCKVKGLPRTLTIVNRLADELGPIKITRVWHSPHVVAAQTAEAFRAVIRNRKQYECSQEAMSFLDPKAGSITTVVVYLRELT